MMWRFCSGSVTPSSLRRNRSRASTTMTRTPSCSKAVASSSVSFLRIMPWSTWTQIRRSPTARWTSVAATAESTPPESAQRTLPSVPVARLCSSTRRRISSTVEAMKLAGVQVWRAPAMLDDEVAQDLAAVRACGRPRGGTGCRTGGAPGRRRRRRASSRCWPSAGSRPAGARSNRRGSSRPAARARGRRRGRSLRGHRDDGRPELLAAEGDDLAAERLGHQVQAVADAEDRDAAGPERRVGMGRARFVDAGRAAGEDHRRRLAGGDLSPRRVEGQQLRVDVAARGRGGR